MPVVLVVGPYRFGFYALDRGERPHVHVRGGGGHAKLWLQPVELATSRGYPRHRLVALVAIATEHEVFPLEQWDRFFGDN